MTPQQILNLEGLAIDLLHNTTLILSNHGGASKQYFYLELQSLEALKLLSEKYFPEELPNINKDEPTVIIQDFEFKIKL